jgi:hypothetical protein
MRRRLVACLAALACGDAVADWTAVGTANEIYAAYADTASIRSSGARTTMVGLYDFRRKDFTPEGLALLSTVVLREYDCAGRRVRLLHAVDFSGHMGGGEAVSVSERPGRWEDVLEAGIDDAYLQVACAAR